MTQRLLDTVFSLGFVKLLWDGVRFVYRRFYHSRVTGDLYIAYETRGPEAEAEKCIFLVVRNRTDKPIGVDMLVWESRFWSRYIRDRTSKNIVSKEPFLRPLAPGEAAQKKFVYRPDNILRPDGRYFGFRLTTGKVVWIKTRRMRRARREIRKDFPDWITHKSVSRPLKLKRYGALGPSPERNCSP